MLRYRQIKEIAKFDGFKDIYRCSRNLKQNSTGAYLAGTRDSLSANYPREYEMIPDYVGDLNQINRVCQRIAIDQQETYTHILDVLLSKKYPREERAFGEPKWDAEQVYLHCTASSELKCEALLRLINKWTDNDDIP